MFEEGLKYVIISYKPLIMISVYQSTLHNTVIIESYHSLVTEQSVDGD